MSVNNSVSEQPDDVGDLPDLYSRELMRKKNTVSEPFYSNDRDVGESAGGYRDWKAKNGMDSSDRMVSSMGRALHNQGIVSQNEGNYSTPHHHDSHSNTLPNTEYRGRDQRGARLNSSEPYYSPHHYRTQVNANEIIYRQGIQPVIRPELIGHHEERQYHHPSRENSEEYIPDNHFDDRCSGQCCSVQNINSPVISPKNHQNTNSREFVNRNRNTSNLNAPHGDYHHCDSDLQREPRVNQAFNRSPCQTNDSRRSTQYQAHRQCHPPPPPQNFHCCQNPTETPRRPDSPRKKSDSNRKSEASIKKLYRILWLQNEQLGLLEKQVSKLIELNFSKESVEKTTESIVEKSNTESPQIIKPETSEIGVMTDLPCPRCVSNENKQSSSDSESEATKKSVVEESLTLNGVEIPVNGAEVTSPPVSMHIDLHDYQDTSSSQTDESDTTEDESEPVGWTFYDNVVGQVNNMLKTANSKKKAHKKKKQAFSDDINMAVEQLKRLGMASSEYDTNNAKRVTFEKGLKEQQVNLRAQSEVSMNFNALASKYLSSASGKVQDISMCNVISGNTNMSMATMRYLERHQIANRDVMDVLSKKNPSVKSRKSHSRADKAVTSKFLDITAIRQQPKLLPKHL